MSDSRLFRIDLTAAGPSVPVADLGRLLPGKGFDSRGSLIVGHDGKVYVLIRVDNDTGFGKGYLHHLVSYDPARNQTVDHGVIAVRNKDWFQFHDAHGKPKPWSHGFHTLPDGTITPLDGYLDPYFQEVYLEAESVPIFSKLAQHVSANALDEYVE